MKPERLRPGGRDIYTLKPPVPGHYAVPVYIDVEPIFLMSKLGRFVREIIWSAYQQALIYGIQRNAMSKGPIGISPKG